MRKRILSFLTLLCIAVALLPTNVVFAATASGTCGDNLTWTLDDSGTLTISGSGEMEEYSQFVNEPPWNDNRSKITNVRINNGVINIGAWAFGVCENLIDITIPDSVTNIGNLAFYGCSSLKNVYISDLKAYLNIEFEALSSIPTSYGQNIYLNNELLTDVVIPDGIEQIPGSVFIGNKNITSITIPNSVISIGQHAFYGCSGLTNVYISDLKAYLNIEFGDNSSMPTSYGHNIYLNNELLTDVVIPDGIEQIPNSVFTGNKNVANLSIPDSVISIENSAFRSCSSLISVTIPDSVTNIGVYAFHDSGIKELNLGSGIKEIGDSAFYTRAGLDKLNVKDITAYLNSGYGIKAKKFYINGKRITDLVIPEDVTKIPSYAFSDNKDFTSVKILGNISSIGNRAFSGCANLTNLTLPDTVESIGNYAFYNCPLGNITIPNGVTTIGDYAFDENNFTELKIPASVKSIGSNAFRRGDFTDITIPKTLTTIGEGAFSLCYKLTSATFENGCKKVGKSMFSDCSALTDITLPDTIETIDENAFSYCRSLTEITIPHNVTEIESGAFNYCSNLATVNYNGNEDDWNDIFISGSNDYLKNAARNYFWYVTLIDEKGEEISKKKYDLNSLVDISDIEPKYEHTIHLFTDKACKNEFDFENTQITENMTLYLKYIPNQYNAKFVDDDGTVLQEGLVDYGAVITPPENPTKDRTQKYTYTFIGWDGFYEGITQTNKEMVFTAKYDATINKYTYKFLDNDNTVLKETTVDYGTVIIPPETPADKDPYTFDYWDGYTSGAELTDDIEFKAVYKYKTYTITAEGLENTVDVVYNDPYELATQEPEEEYLFDGYYTEKDGKGTKITDKDGKSLKNYDFLNNITVYPYFPHELLNKIKINGESSTVVGNTDVVKKVYFATDKDAQYLLCNIKFPESIELKEIVPIDFKYVSEESRTISDGMVYLNLICQYTNNLDSLPINKKVEPFELVFDIPKNIAPQSVSIEVTADSMVIGDEEYGFDYIINGELEIAAKPVESIEIIGESTVILEKGNINYTAEITPDWATNKEVEWSLDNEEIATISQEGIFTPKTTGTVVITATAKDGSGISDTKTVNIIGYAKIDTLKTNAGQWETAFDPNVREYTVYAPKNATEISFTAGFSSGTLKLVNGNEKHTMMKNKPRTVNIENGETNIVLLKENVDGCADSEYKIKIVKFEGTKTTVSDNGTKFTVTPINIKGGTVILALYNGDTFVEMQSKPYTDDDTFTTDKAYTTAKVMVWDSLESMTPICDVEIVK